MATCIRALGDGSSYFIILFLIQFIEEASSRHFVKTFLGVISKNEFNNYKSTPFFIDGLKISNIKITMKMKFTYLTMLIYFILSLSSYSAAETFTLSCFESKRGEDMAEDSGVFCLNYSGSISTTTVTLVENVNNAADIRYEAVEFLNDGKSYLNCWPFHESADKLFHFDYVLHPATSVSATNQWPPI